VVAKVGGRDPRVLGAATEALLSPDGREVVALETAEGRAVVTVYGTARRGGSRVVAVLAPPDFSAHAVKLLGWSPDSRLVALSTNELSGSGAQGVLLVLDVQGGMLTRIATGTFLGASFAPQRPDRLVYARASIVQLDDNEASLWTAQSDGSDQQELTDTGLARDPLWTPAGIFFARLERLGSRTSPPLYGLWRIAANGTALERLGDIEAGPPAGPLAASASGRRILADFDSPSGGAVQVWTVALLRRGVLTRQLTLPAVGDGVSRDGKLVLATMFGSPAQIETLRWDGELERTLANGASGADWNQ